MEENKKKFYEVTEDERKQKYKESFKRNWPTIRKVLFGIFCVLLILLMVFALVAGIIWGGKGGDSSSSDAVSHCIKWL